MTQVYTVDGFADLYETAEQLPDVEKRGTILAANDRTDETEVIGYRTPLISEHESVVGDVSRNHYQVAQFEDIIANLGQAAEQYDDQLRPTGHVMVSDDDRKLTSYLGFDGVTAEPLAGDELELGIKTRAAHTGVHGITYDIGAERLVCSNGMIAFDAEKSFYQDHNEPLDYTLAQRAVDSVVEGVDAVEQRVQRAHDQEFVNWEEAVITLRELGIGDEFEDSVAVVGEALETELDGERRPPTLWEAYNAATRLYSHGEGVTAEQRDWGLDRAAQLLDDYGEVPDAAELGRTAVTRRSEDLTAEDAEPLWEDEREAVSELLTVHGEQ